MARSPTRGEIVLMDLNPTRGHEQAGTRPFLVLSVDQFNRGPAELLIGIPLTTKDRRIRTHVPIDPPEGDLTERSFAMVEAIRSVSRQRLIRRLGVVTPETLAAVEDRLRPLLGLR